MTTASTAVSAPPAYYSVSNPEDPTAVRARELVRREYELRRALSADLNPEHDVDVLAASIARSTGFGRRAIQNNLMAMLTLHELPRLRALQEQLWHLDCQQLRAIDIALCAADRSYFDAVDEQLTDYLTATRPNQLLPGPRAIRNRIKAILDSLDDTIDTDEPDWPDNSYRLKTNPDGTADLTARFSAADAAEIDARVRALAVAEGLTLAEAHVALLRGHEGV